MKTYDVVVAGLGAMGSAAVYHLVRRGARVLGLDRFEPGHDRGSSHGGTRIIRLGYFEHPSYVPLLRRAYELWRELEVAADERFLHITGIAEIGRPDGALIAGTLASSRLHSLPHEVLDARELMRRYPAFHVPAEFVAVVQPDGGFLSAEPAVQAHQRLAQRAGAELRFGEAVRQLDLMAGGGRVTNQGQRNPPPTRGVFARALAQKSFSRLALLRAAPRGVGRVPPPRPARFLA